MRAAEFQRLNNTAPQASEMWQRTETAPHRTESAPRNETQRVPVARGVQTSERLLTTTSRGAQTSERPLTTMARGVQTTPPGGQNDDAETQTDPQHLRVCAEAQTEPETEKRVFANARKAAESIFLRRYEMMNESDEEADLSMVSYQMALKEAARRKKQADDLEKKAKPKRKRQPKSGKDAAQEPKGKRKQKPAGAVPAVFLKGARFFSLPPLLPPPFSPVPFLAK